MQHKVFILVYVLCLALCISARHISSPRASTTCSSAVSWTSCPDDAQFDCGSFQVPLDYAQPDVGNATLAIARFKATKKPRLGTIFTNPGGPGGSGVEFLVSQAGMLISAITQGQYDIVSWDPRGVNQSRPLISCGFTSLDSFEEFFGNTIPLMGFEARGNFTDQDDLDAFFAKVNETDAKIVQTGQRCLEADGAFLKYMGTAAVARDMVSLSDCLDGPEKPINYWGFSYGTDIGNYFVNMFPERVGRVILDGVDNTITWATQPTFKMAGESLAATESVLEGFAQKCAQAGPQNCAISRNDSTPASILRDIQNLIDTAYDLHKAGISNITSFSIRDFILGELFDPTTWDAELVPQLQAWEAIFANQTAGNASVGVEASRSRPGILRSRKSTETSDNAVDPIVQSYFSEFVITCVDSIDQEYVTTERLFEEIVRVTHDVAPTFGEALLTIGSAYCHRFPVRAVERFTGPFNHTLASTILVIGNKADPITPFANAQKIAATLGASARLVEQDGLGHSSLAENSDCTQGVVRDYFLHGTLPMDGLVCETDQALFPPNNTLVSPSPMRRRQL